MARFELVTIVKDAQGNPTNRKRSITTDSGETLAKAWADNNPSVKKKKKKHEAAKTATEISYGLKEYQKHLDNFEKIKKAQKLED